MHKRSPTDIPSTDTEEVARQIKKYFGEAFKQRYQKPWKPHARYKAPEIWIAAADKCQELKVSPREFVEAAFTFCVVPGGPFPQNLASRAMDKWCRENKSLSGLKTDSNSETEQLQKLIQEVLFRALRLSAIHGVNMAEVLTNDFFIADYEVPAFIRVLLLPEDERVNQLYRPRGRVEILGNPDLLKMLKELNWDLSWVGYGN